jgi:hypothetical protein
MVEKKGKYVLAPPVPGQYPWWEINDMEGMFAVFTVQESFPNAEKVARFAFEQIAE